MIHQKKIQNQWVEAQVSPFDEMLFSWNAKRPNDGSYSFFVSVKVDNIWSEFMPYATWGTSGQAGCSSELKNFPAKVFQDAIQILQEKKATGFQIKIVCDGSATLEGIQSLHVYTNGEKKKPPTQNSMKEKIQLNIEGMSQMVLDHPRNKALCSPTSTTAVVRHLLNQSEIQAVDFAKKSYEAKFNIYGNWVFNVSHASSLLGPKWDCWVERLSCFEEIYHQLQRKTPVVVSVKGPLVGSGCKANNGHLIVVTGYNPETNRVLCMDPGLSSDDKTHVSFKLEEFMEAWGRRGNIAYIFKAN